MNILKPPESSNCIKDENVPFIEWDNIMDGGEEIKVNIPIEMERNEIAPEEEIAFEDIIEKNALSYISGYFAKKLVSKHKECSSCQIISSININSTENIFITNKTFTTPNTKGALTISSNLFLNFCKEIKSIFTKNFKQNVHKFNISRLLKEKFRVIEGKVFCSEEIREHFVDVFITFLINSYVKVINRNYKESKEKLRRKNKIVLHQ